MARSPVLNSFKTSVNMYGSVEAGHDSASASVATTLRHAKRLQVSAEVRDQLHGSARTQVVQFSDGLLVQVRWLHG